MKRYDKKTGLRVWSHGEGMKGDDKQNFYFSHVGDPTQWDVGGRTIWCPRFAQPLVLRILNSGRVDWLLNWIGGFK